MSRIERQLLQNHQRQAALTDAAGASSARDEPIRLPADLPRGIARIVSNEGDGAYKITEQWWAPTDGSWTDAVAPLGLVEAPAVDWMGRSGGAVGQLVKFHQTRTLQGQTAIFLDSGNSSQAVTRFSSFCVHYSGSNTTAPFFTVPGCLHSLVQTIISARECSQNDPGGEHPGFIGMAMWGPSSGWFNALDTWVGGDWQDLWYQGYDRYGTFLGIAGQAMTGLYIQARVTAGGDLELRVDRDPTGNTSCIIHGVVCVVSMPEPPGTVEIGNCCCHDDDWGVV